jgi:hypothetical protein
MGVGMGGLATGRRWRAATEGSGLPSLRGSPRTRPLRLACCHGTDELGCGRGRQSFDARCELLVCSACCRNVCESCTRANFGSAPRVRTASQRITLGRAFDCLILEGSGGAMAPACGAILADHEHVCVILACRAAWTGCREAHVQSFGAHHRVLGTCGDAGTCLGMYLEIICRGRKIIPRAELELFTPRPSRPVWRERVNTGRS